MKTTWIFVLVLCSLAETILACIPGCSPVPKKPPTKASDIAVEAKKKVGSTLWSFKSSHGTGCDTNKCNTFVADMIERAGGSVPQRHVWKKSPIGAREWEKPKSTYLTGDPHWVLVTGTPRRGDIAALGGHVGIVTGPGTTISATATNIVENDWGFRPGQKPTFWRYVP